MMQSRSRTLLLAPTVSWMFMGVAVLQWALIAYLLQERSHHVNSIPSVATTGTGTGSTGTGTGTGTAVVRGSGGFGLSTTVTSLAEFKQFNGQDQFLNSKLDRRGDITTITKQTKPAGVAATIFFSGPAWFHRRYPVVILNVLANIPRDWIVQLFVHPHYWQTQVLPLHPGLDRLLAQYSDRIVLTDLPNELQQIKQPNQRIPLESWFWETMEADRVLLFSGNGIMCTHGNTQEHWDALMDFDYIGVPFHHHNVQRLGGDGSTHSYRNRTMMLYALEYAKTKNIPTRIPEHVFYLDVLEQMQKDTPILMEPMTATISTSTADIHTADTEMMVIKVRLATPDDSIWFGGVQTTNATVMGHRRPIPPPPMVVSGTQAHLSFQHREDLLMVCPELKVIFPSLHNPACFGAHPDPDSCRATICALRDELPASGC